MNSNISDKDKKDWHNFLKKNEKLSVKDVDVSFNDKLKSKSFDLHGYSLDDANQKVKDLIYNSYEEGIKKLTYGTGLSSTGSCFST